MTTSTYYCIEHHSQRLYLRRDGAGPIPLLFERRDSALDFLAKKAEDGREHQAGFVVADWRVRQCDVTVRE